MRSVEDIKNVRQLIDLVKKLMQRRDGVSTVEYGLTAVLAAGAILSIAFVVQNSLLRHDTTKCNPLGVIGLPPQ